MRVKSVVLLFPVILGGTGLAAAQAPRPVVEHLYSADAMTKLRDASERLRQAVPLPVAYDHHGKIVLSVCCVETIRFELHIALFTSANLGNP